MGGREDTRDSDSPRAQSDPSSSGTTSATAEQATQRSRGNELGSSTHSGRVVLGPVAVWGHSGANLSHDSAGLSGQSISSRSSDLEGGSYRSGRDEGFSPPAPQPPPVQYRVNPEVARRRGFKQGAFRVARENAVVNFDGSTLGLSPVDDRESSGPSTRSAKGSSYNSTSHVATSFAGSFNAIALTKCLNCIWPNLTASREEHKMPTKQVQWWQVTLYLINDVIGAWLILFSARVLAKMGWLIGILSLVIMWPLNLYVGHLLWRCRNTYIGAISIGDLVYYVTHSSVVMYIAFFFIGVTIAFTLASQIDSAAVCFAWLLGRRDSEGCFGVLSAIILAMLFPLSQLRTLFSLTAINAINVLCVLVFVAIFAYQLVATGKSPESYTRFISKASLLNLTPNGDDKEHSVFGSLALVIGAYYYQIIALEIMAEMKHPEDFPKANYWTTPVVSFVAGVCSCLRYWFQGETQVLLLDSTAMILRSLFGEPERANALGYVAVSCFMIHMLSCCLIRTLVLSRQMHLLIHPVSINQKTWRARLEWMGCSIFVLTVSWGLLLLIRNVDDMTNVVGLLAALSSLLLPCLLFIATYWQAGKLSRVPAHEWVLLALVLAVVIFALLGIVLGWAYQASNNPEDEAADLSRLFQCSDFGS